MINWRIARRDGLDIVGYKAKVKNKTDYILDYESTKGHFDTWGIEISRGGGVEQQFSVYLLFKVKHGPDYDKRVLQGAEDRIKQLLQDVKP